MAFTQAFQNKALLTYICAGDPDLGATADVLCALDDAGADVLEVGVPFSDPVADGPVIQEASTRALARKTSLGGVLEMLHSVKGALRAPRVIMSYVNPLAAYGFDRFARDAREGGVSGVLVPDLPRGESAPLERALSEKGVILVRMVSPNSSDRRLAAVGEGAEGFIYCVSLLGVTGEGARIRDTVPAYLGRVRRHTRVPLALGFGIDGPERARALAPHADGLVVGSALVSRIHDHRGNRGAMLREVKTFAASMKEVLR